MSLLASLCPPRLLLAWLALLAAACQGNAADRPLASFFDAYCLDCHRGAEGEGQVDLSTWPGASLGPATVPLWTRAHDRLAAGEMPPAAAPQPSPAARQAALEKLNASLQTASQAHREVVLRRLNRREYEWTVRDLFGIEILVKAQLPADTPTAGFDNVGAGLAVSAEAAQAYLRAADTTLDAVFGPAEPPPRISHTTNLLDQKTHDGKPALAKHIGSMFRQTEAGLVIFQSGYCPTNLVNFSRQRAPAGWYRGTFRVRAIQSDQPVTLRIYGGDTIVGRREKHLVGYFDVPPDRWTTIEFEDRLVEPGGTFQPKCYGTKDTRKEADSYPEPGIEISTITIEGPLAPWPPESRSRLLGDVAPETAGLTEATAIVRRLLPRAFRRPIRPAEVTPYRELMETAFRAGASFESSLRLGLKAVLCAPEFLFMEEAAGPAIDQYALATRLSYFLWSSLPDEPLFRHARAGSLNDPAVLRAQVERMLADPKSQRFVENFTGQWLDLREIDFTQPDENLYPEFDELLKLSMVEESHRFFAALLEEDLPLQNLIDADFTFLNQRLAEHYGIPGVPGQAFRKVTLPADSVRGGVLTQASLLKVTANGTTTSPVLRGAWVLERLLGQQVPPPPDNIPAVEPDIRGATTLREQLALHQQAASCAVCHRQIDPPGFALEHFDVIGRWRDRYRTLGEGDRPDYARDPHTYRWVRFRYGAPVDASGTTADGQAFRDIHDFKRLLLADERAIILSFTRQLATYALGRPLGFSDREELARLVDATIAPQAGLRSLLHRLVQSPLFRSP